MCRIESVVVPATHTKKVTHRTRKYYLVLGFLRSVLYLTPHSSGSLVGVYLLLFLSKILYLPPAPKPF